MEEDDCDLVDIRVRQWAAFVGNGYPDVAREIGSITLSLRHGDFPSIKNRQRN